MTDSMQDQWPESKTLGRFLREEEIKNIIRESCIHHGEEGTSAYLLSDNLIDKIYEALVKKGVINGKS